jgi:hypothetical protein
MKKIYTQPAIDIENVMVESGIAASPTYGDENQPGQEGGWNDGEL